ncbi:hypothetical protein [Stakelama marina]|uniref:C-type lysozyme inhibitor domain-containing protein n=1 Tax=Stakelama marina TaxID=2826939 RepID=A0A8T4IBC0_9SPHN|nr:hypothetical protein [Stakelama marina]MBR0551114.1 hypothetical protein [Stakelama marina]
MKKTLFTLCTALVALPLAACNHKPEVVDTRAPDPMNDALQNAAPVELPPSMTASKSFRCSDNSLVYVDFFSGGKEVHFRETKDGNSAVLKANDEGGPWTDGSVTVKGDQNSITYTKDGKSLTCKA